MNKDDFESFVLYLKYLSETPEKSLQLVYSCASTEKFAVACYKASILSLGNKWNCFIFYTFTGRKTALSHKYVLFIGEYFS